LEFRFNNISYTKVGTGPHLCFLHGFCESSIIWSNLIEQLSQEYTCIAIDLPGFGQSDHLKFGTISEIANAVHNILNHEKALSCTLFGHSMGGYVLAEYLHKYGHELNAAGFIHSTALEDSETKKSNRQKTIDFIKVNGTDEFFKLFVPSLVAPEHLASLKNQLTALVYETKTESILDGLKAMMHRPSRIESFEAFTKPILFLKGERDQHYTNTETYLQASKCQIAQISEIEHVGHLSMYEDADHCYREIKRFLVFVQSF